MKPEVLYGLLIIILLSVLMFFFGIITWEIALSWYFPSEQEGMYCSIIRFALENKTIAKICYYPDGEKVYVYDQKLYEGYTTLHTYGIIIVTIPTILFFLLCIKDLIWRTDKEEKKSARSSCH